MRHARKKTKRLHYPKYRYNKKTLLYHVTCPDCIWRGLSLYENAARAVALAHYYEKNYDRKEAAPGNRNLEQ